MCNPKTQNQTDAHAAHVVIQVVKAAHHTNSLCSGCKCMLVTKRGTPPSFAQVLPSAIYMDVLKCPQSSVGQLRCGSPPREHAVLHGQSCPLGSTCHLVVWLRYCVTFMRFVSPRRLTVVCVCVSVCKSQVNH